MPATMLGTSEDLLAELANWVAMETPTTDAAAVNRLMDVAEGELAAAGAALTRIPGRDGVRRQPDRAHAGRGQAGAGRRAISTPSGRTARWTACRTR